jgi:hypothetical protein
MLETLHVGVIDLVIVAITLLFMLLGIKNGFIKELAGIGAFIGALVLAYFLTDMVRQTVVDLTNVNILLFNQLNTSVFSNNDSFTFVIDPAIPNLIDLLTAEFVTLGIPGFVAGPLADTVSQFNGTLGEALATAATNAILFVLGYVVTFILSWIILKVILSQFVKLTESIKVFKLLDGILGVVMGVVRAGIVVGGALLLAGLLSFVIPDIQNFLNQDLALLDSAKFSIGKFAFEWLMSMLTNLTNL